MYRSTKIGLDTILDRDKYKHAVRKCKIICTLGPQCDSEEMLGKLLDAGMNVARCVPRPHLIRTSSTPHRAIGCGHMLCRSVLLPYLRAFAARHPHQPILCMYPVSCGAGVASHM